MKKLLTLLLALAMLLTGCTGDTGAANAEPPAEETQQEVETDLIEEVIANIDAIISVTPESEAKIQLAEKLYDSLSREERKQVTNAKKLVDARDEFDRMEKDIDTVIDLIEAIGEVTSSKVSIIRQARKNYDALGADLQKYVGNYEDLEEAESTYGKMVGQEAYDEFLAEFESEQALDALETAEEFMNTEYGPEFADEVNELCCGAYVKLAKWYLNKSDYKTTLYYVDEGRELYAETETVTQLDDVEISAAVAAISAIGTVTLDSKDKIQQAEELYGRLDEDGKKNVSNAKTLTNARKSYDQLGKDIEAVVKLIDNIGEVSLSKSDAITKARSAYNKLDEASQKHVSNYDKLTKAENSIYSLKAKEAYDEFVDEFNGLSASDAIALSKKFLDSQYGSKYASQVKELCCGAYVKLVKWYINNGNYKSAKAYLEEGISLCAGASNVSQLYALEDSVKVSSVEEPYTGEILSDTLGEGRNYIIVDNSGSSYSSRVKLVLSSDTRKYKIFYVRAGGKATISLPDGEYVITRASGKVWYGESSLFGDATSYSTHTVTFNKTTYTISS